MENVYGSLQQAAVGSCELQEVVTTSEGCYSCCTDLCLRAIYARVSCQKVMSQKWLAGNLQPLLKNLSNTECQNCQKSKLNSFSSFDCKRYCVSLFCRVLYSSSRRRCRCVTHWKQGWNVQLSSLTENGRTKCSIRWWTQQSTISLGADSVTWPLCVFIGLSICHPSALCVTPPQNCYPSEWLYDPPPHTHTWWMEPSC